MKRRHGITVIDIVITIAVLAVLVGLLSPAVYQARENALKTEIKKKIRPSEDAYQETLISAVTWLLSETDGPLDPLARGIFIGSIKNGEGSTLTKNEGALSAFAMMDWPNAKKAEKLCSDMRGFLGLMETAEGTYLHFAQTEFNARDEALRAMLPEKERKPRNPR